MQNLFSRNLNKAFRTEPEMIYSSHMPVALYSYCNIIQTLAKDRSCFAFWFVFSSFLEKNQIENLMSIDGIDIWKVDQEGNMDFRIARRFFENVSDEYSNCEESGNIEEIVKRAEKMHSVKKANTSQLEWFDEYVSYVLLVPSQSYIYVCCSGGIRGIRKQFTMQS